MVAEDPLPRLTTAQVAARLGIKRETVYAYVSRGLLTSVDVPGPRRASTFDPLEVEALAARVQARSTPTRAGRDREPVGAGRPLMVIDSSLTLVQDDRLWFRGSDAAELARTKGFEEVATWFWTGQWVADATFEYEEQALPQGFHDFTAGLTLVDRMRVALAAVGSANPLRYDLRPAAVVAAMSRALPAMVLSLGGPTKPAGTGTAVRMWSALSARPPAAQELRALEAALILLIDHDLAVSTLAARIAASARAHPCAVVSAGLAPMDGLLHGAASGQAYRMLADVIAGADPARVVNDVLYTGRPLPAFGHRLYRDGDPRAAVLIDLLAGSAAHSDALAAAAALEAVVAPAGLWGNVDLAMAVLTLGADMPTDAGEALFAVARTVGWTAHAIEEYALPGLRLRPSGHYVGPEPRR